MHPIGLGALQQRDVTKASGGFFQWLEQVSQHRIIGRDLVIFEPAFYQAGFFIQRGVDKMRDIPHRTEYFCALLCICKIGSYKFRAKSLGGFSP